MNSALGHKKRQGHLSEIASWAIFTIFAFGLFHGVAAYAADYNVHVIEPESHYTSWLGLTIQEIDDYNAAKYKLPGGVTRGLAVVDIIKGGPAGEAGLEKGDVILSLDGRDLEGYDEFSNWLREFEVGSTIKLLVSRGGAVKDVFLTLGSIPGELLGGYGFLDPWLKDYLAEADVYGGCHWLKESREYDILFYKAYASLDLNEKQKKAAAAMMSVFEKEMIRITADIRVGEIELRELITARDVDMKKVRSKINELSSRGAEAEYLRLKTREELKRLLTDKERKEIEKELELFREQGWIWRRHGMSPLAP